MKTLSLDELGDLVWTVVEEAPYNFAHCSLTFYPDRHELQIIIQPEHNTPAIAVAFKQADLMQHKQSAVRFIRYVRQRIEDALPKPEPNTLGGDSCYPTFT